jgi:hypothetical protein
MVDWETSQQPQPTAPGTEAQPEVSTTPQQNGDVTPASNGMSESQDEVEEAVPVSEEVRKEPEKVELTEEQKAQEKAKPVSSTPVPGTPWYIVIFHCCFEIAFCAVGVWYGQETLESSSTTLASDCLSGKDQKNCKVAWMWIKWFKMLLKPLVNVSQSMLLLK